MAFKRAFIILIFTSISFSLSITSPFNYPISPDGVYYLGEMGPGQAMGVVIDKVVKTGGILGKGGYYDTAYAYDLPDGWTQKPAADFSNPLQVIIRSSPDAPEGDYKIPLRLIDYGEGLENITIFVIIHINDDIMDASVDSDIVYAGVGQPVRNIAYVTNKGNAGDVFNVSVNCSSGWNSSRVVYVPMNSTVPVPIEAAFYDEDIFTCDVNVFSVSAPNINKQERFAAVIMNSLFMDIVSTSKGTLLFYPIEGLIYSISALIGSNF